MIEKTSLKKPLTQVRGSFLNKLLKTTIKDVPSRIQSIKVGSVVSLIRVY